MSSKPFVTTSGITGRRQVMAGLEVALTTMMQDYDQRSLQLKDCAEKAKKDALAAATVVSDLLVDTLNGDVQKAFLNEKQIAIEVQALAATVQRFVKQTNQWLGVANAFDVALKEIGDFENWIKVMEYDCERIASAVRHLSLVSGRTSFT